MIPGAIIFFSSVTLFYLGYRAYLNSRKVPASSLVAPGRIAAILQDNVLFYEKLNEEDRRQFLYRVRIFLERVKINGVGAASITEEDRVLIAAAGVMPLFRYRKWLFNNLNEVLLYPDSFNIDFSNTAHGWPLAGLVGDGALHRTMVLSLPWLRSGFRNSGATNTAVHEFAHLLDKADGATDGVPELILKERHRHSWIRMMYEYMDFLRYNPSDIDAYASVNEAEFFAVVSEYYFQQPSQLQANHPELYQILHDGYENK